MEGILWRQRWLEVFPVLPLLLQWLVPTPSTPSARGGHSFHRSAFCSISQTCTRAQAHRQLDRHGWGWRFTTKSWQHSLLVWQLTYCTPGHESAFWTTCLHHCWWVLTPRPTTSCAPWEQRSSRKGCQKNGGKKNRQDQFCEKLLKEYKGRVCICMVLSHIHRDTGQKFCPTKAVWGSGELQWGQRRNHRSWNFSLWFCWWRIQKKVQFLLMQHCHISGLPAHSPSWSISSSRSIFIHACTMLEEHARVTRLWEDQQILFHHYPALILCW